MMDKNEIKSICEDDDRLQWWAMVLFAEISELIKTNEHRYGGVDNASTIYSIVKSKVTEFPGLLIQREVERANSPQSELTVEERLKRLEDLVLNRGV